MLGVNDSHKAKKVHEVELQEWKQREQDCWAGKYLCQVLNQL